MMKKNLVRVFASAMALATVLTLSACGNDNNSSSSAAGSTPASSTVESSTPASSTAESSAAESAAGLPASGKFATIDEFVNSDIVQSQLSSMMASMGDDMDITIAGEGDKLIYTFKFEEGTETEGMAEALEAAMETQAATFEGIAASLKDAVEVENPIVVVTYADSEGNEIYSREFTSAE